MPTEPTDPIFRWAGSKRWLVSQLRATLPSRYNQFHEPFLGSGALFFAIQPTHAYLGDVCSPLIDAYEAIRAHPGEVFDHFSQWAVDRETFLCLRSDYRSDPVFQAARFIYLNRTAWNGLYRVNSRAEFNVPFGAPKTANMPTLDHLNSVARTMQEVTLRAEDFGSVISRARSGDLVYFDPPYATLGRGRSFVDYNSKLFAWEDQIRLAELCALLVKQGTHVIISNADAPEIEALYKTFRTVRFNRISTIASRASARQTVTELLFVSKTW